MTISRLCRTSARQIDTSQRSAVDRLEIGAVSGKPMPTRPAIGWTSPTTCFQSTMPRRVRLGAPSMMFSTTLIRGTSANSWWMKLRP